MTRLATLFTCSFRRLKEVRTVTVCAMLGAIAIVLGSLSIDLGPSVRIGFQVFQMNWSTICLVLRQEACLRGRLIF